MFIVFGNLISAQVNHYSLLGLRTVTRSCGLIILTIICIKQSIKMPDKMKINIGLSENDIQIVVRTFIHFVIYYKHVIGSCTLYTKHC